MNYEAYVLMFLDWILQWAWQWFTKVEIKMNPIILRDDTSGQSILDFLEQGYSTHFSTFKNWEEVCSIIQKSNHWEECLVEHFKDFNSLTPIEQTRCVNFLRNSVLECSFGFQKRLFQSIKKNEKSKPKKEIDVIEQLTKPVRVRSSNRLATHIDTEQSSPSLEEEPSIIVADEITTDSVKDCIIKRHKIDQDKEHLLNVSFI